MNSKAVGDAALCCRVAIYINALAVMRGWCEVSLLYDDRFLSERFDPFDRSTWRSGTESVEIPMIFLVPHMSSWCVDGGVANSPKFRMTWSEAAIAHLFSVTSFKLPAR